MDLPPPGDDAPHTPPAPRGWRPTPLDLQWLVGCHLLGFLAVGIPFWMLDYSAMTLPGSLPLPGLMLVGALSMYLAVSRPIARMLVVLVMAGAIVDAWIVRVAIDLVRDPTTHNLLPFEFVIVGFVSVAWAGGGVLAGRAWVAAGR